jgi:hypothetical protein
LTVSPFGVVVAPLRALADPTMDDSMRASIIGALIGVPLGAYVGREIALDVAMMRMPGELRNNPEVYGRLYKNEEKWGTPLASSMAESIGKVYPYSARSKPGGTREHDPRRRFEEQAASGLHREHA